MNKLSLTELEKTKNDLIKYIKSDKDYLDDYKYFYHKDGEFYFSISFTGLHRNTTETKLDDLCDIKTGKPLNKKEKENIERTCDQIVKYESRLKEVDKEILILKFGEDFSEQSKKTAGTKISDEERINQFIDLTIKLNSIPKGDKHIDKTLYRKLTEKSFLINFINTVQGRTKANYRYSLEKLELLKDLELHFSQKLESVIRKNSKLKKQVKANEFSDEIDYGNQNKKRNKKPEY